MGNGLVDAAMDKVHEEQATQAMAEVGALRTSPTFEKLAGALAKAQAAMGHARKDAENPHFRSNYADLAAVREAAAPLHANEVAILQPVRTRGKLVLVTTMLVHSSGQWMAADCEMEAADARPQTIGSCITYARRYSLAGLLAIAADEDDDGNAASGRDGGGGGEKRPARKEAAPTPEKAGRADPVKTMELTKLLLELQIGFREAEAADKAGKPEKRKEAMAEARAAWVAKVIGRRLDGPEDLTAADVEACLVAARKQLGSKEAA